MFNDSTQRELYNLRANSLRDKISELNSVERKVQKKVKKYNFSQFKTRQ